MDNYAQLLEKISRAASLSTEEIERKIEAKRAKLSGLVSKEGAAQIVAAELGLNFDKERMKISELVQGMRKANILGKVTEVYPVRSYSKNGRDGKVANIVIADESSNVRAVLWDTNHILLIEQGKLNKGDVVEISNAQVRNGELHLSAFSDIKLSNEKIEKVMVEKVFGAKKLSEAKSGQNLKARAFIVQVFDPRYFEVCPECGKKVTDTECKVHGKVEPKRRAILNIVLDDGSETIRGVLFGEHINKLGLLDEEIFSLERFAEKKQSILGDEKVFSGNVRSNALYNTIEFNIEQIDDLNADVLLKELESRA